MKQYLIDETKRQIAVEEQEINTSEQELRTLEAKIKVGNKFLNTKDIEQGLKDDVKYSVIALQDMLVMEKQKNDALKKDLEISKYKVQVIDSFRDDQL